MSEPHDDNDPKSAPLDDATARIVKARQQLMERFQTKLQQTPSLQDDKPQGKGPKNRHGMPQVPVGQTLTDKWPVLDLGHKPVVTKEAWRLVVDGAVEAPTTLDWSGLMALPAVDDTSDFHCVTTWSKLDVPWRGVRVSTVLALAQPKANATHVMVHGADGYTTNVALEEVLKDDVLLTWQAYGEPLSVEHGGPVRMITPQLYAWKGAKWVNRIQLLTANKRGFWEQRGYSDTAWPWRNDRYG